MGTPHRGSDFANDYTRWLSRKLISLPDMLVRAKQRIVRDNPGYRLNEHLNRIVLSDDDRAAFANNMLMSMKRGQVFVIAKQAGSYTGPELVEGIRRFAEADKAMVSSSVPPRIVLEDLLFRTMARPAGP